MQVDIYTLVALLIGGIGGVALLAALGLDLRGESPGRRSKPGGSERERHPAGEPASSRYEKAGKGT